jgi:hypothetical protein
MCKNLAEYEEEDRCCVNCEEVFYADRDICLCDSCCDLFDLDKLWKLHDKNKLDALDFNELKSMRDKFRK